MDLLIYSLNILLIVLVGFILGKLVEKIKLPAVLGYIIAGMLIGPFALNLINLDLLDSGLFKLIAGIAIGYVGYMVGAGIHLDEVKKSGKSISVIAIFETFTPFVLVFLAGLIFLDLDMWSSLVLGSIALATAPALALALSKDMKTDGPLTKTLMPIVAIDDIIAILAFGFIIAFAGSSYSGEELSLIDPILEIGISVVVGLGFGYLGKLAVEKWIDNKATILTVMSMLLVAMIAVTVALHGEAIMAGMAFGVLVTNSISKEQNKKLNILTGPMVGFSLLIFLVLIGATLDVSTLLSIAALLSAVLYVVTRGFGKISGAYIGAKLTHSNENVQKYLGFALLSHAGISLAFAGIAVSVLPSEYGVIVGATVAGAAIINEFIAAFATQWAFDKSGEAGKKT